MSREDSNKLHYVIALIAEFAHKFNIDEKQSFNYIRRFKGYDYIKSYYDVIHTMSFEDAVEGLAIVCNHNGGKLVY